MRQPPRDAVVGSVSIVSLALVAALHLDLVAVSLLRAMDEPSPDHLGYSATQHVVDLATSSAFLFSVACCAALVTRCLRSGRTAPGVEVWAALVDYNWNYRDYQTSGDVGCRFIDFVGADRLSGPLLAPAGCLWFERLDA